MTLPQDYLCRMQQQLGPEYDSYLRAMDLPPLRTLRVNTLKTDAAALMASMNVLLEPTGVTAVSFYVPDGFQPSRSIEHRTGLFYMQDLSAQLPVTALPLHAGMAVLDLCAAPGGKSGQIASYLKNKGLLIANEPSPPRARILSGNLERLGVTNAVVTSMQPDKICRLLAGCFDAVLVDAPCSGEGMFRKDEQAVRDWSPAHVRACAARQAAILEEAAAALRPGGSLVYSTCTFSPDENEEQIENFLRAHADFSCDLMKHVYPQDGMGEGQFYARLIRSGCGLHGMHPSGRTCCAVWEEFQAEFLPGLPPQYAKQLPDGRVFLLPELFAPSYEQLHIVCAGTLAGEVKNGRFFPAHALVMAWPQYFRQHVALRDAGLSAYLRGESVPCDASLSGWCAVTGNGLALGIGKAVAGMLKNHLPKGLRN